MPIKNTLTPSNWFVILLPCLGGFYHSSLAPCVFWTLLEKLSFNPALLWLKHKKAALNIPVTSIEKKCDQEDPEKILTKSVLIVLIIFCHRKTCMTSCRGTVLPWTPSKNFSPEREQQENTQQMLVDMVNIFTRLSPSFAFSETQGGDFLSTDSVAFILIYSFAFFALLIFVGFKAAKKGWDIWINSRKTRLWSRCRMEQSRDESRFSIPRENVFPRMNSNQASRLPPCGHPWCRSERKREKKVGEKIPVAGKLNTWLEWVSRLINNPPPMRSSWEKNCPLLPTMSSRRYTPTDLVLMLRSLMMLMLMSPPSCLLWDR